MTTELVPTASPSLDLATLLATDPRLRSQHTRRAYAHDLGQFEAWRAGRPLTRTLVEAYVAHLLATGHSPRSVNRALAATRWWARKVADLAYDHLPPDQRAEVVAQAERVASVGDVKAPAKAQRGRHVSPGEFDALLRACLSDPSAAGRRDAAMLALAWATGLRRGEVVALTLADLAYEDNEAARLTVRGKGGKERLLYLFDGALDALADWLAVRGETPGPLFCPVDKAGRPHPGRGLSTQALADALERRRTEAGVKPLTWHDLRRTFAGDLLDGGADIATVQKLMGHASPATTSAYDRRPEEVRKRALRTRHVPYYTREGL